MAAVLFNRYAVGPHFKRRSVGSLRCASATHGYSRSAAPRLAPPDALAAMLPLPEGEGRGEGEGRVIPNRLRMKGEAHTA